MSTDFYNSIAAQYDEIFPFKPQQFKFVLDLAGNPGQKELLDIGCGTGSLSIELGKKFKSVIGIDLDEAMLEKAQSKAEGNVRFEQLDMLKILERFGKSAFDTILCFGNTLVHLESDEAIASFLDQSRKLLRPGGQLLIQIINYDRIFEQNLKGLPSIKTENLVFTRKYNYDKNSTHIDFQTILQFTASGTEVVNHVDLYPIRKKELSGLIKKAGFRNLEYYGNFKGEAFSSESQPLIIACQV